MASTRIVSGARDSARVLADGDSWFDLPLKSDIVQELRRPLPQRPALDITKLAQAGNTLQYLLAAPTRSGFYRALRDEPYDLLLFSGGGNDILSDFSLRPILRRKTPGTAPRDLLDMTSLDRRLADLGRLYERLIATVAQVSRNPSIKIIAHTYDFMWPRHAPYDVPAWVVEAARRHYGISVPGLRAAPGQASVPVRGPWIDPIMRERGITDPAEKHELTRLVLSAFGTMLQDTAARSAGRLVVVDTQGTLGPEHWSDEIHPSAAGARLLADKIYTAGIAPHLPATLHRAHG